MSHDNVAVFHRWAECWNRRDLEAGLRERVQPDAEWLPITAALEGAAYHGHEGIRAWTESLFHDWEVFEITVDEVRELAENRILGLGSWRARGRGSGLELGQQASWLTEFREGKIARMQTFTDRRKALEAAGL